MCGFSSLEGAVNTTVQVLQMGVAISRIELLDELSIEAANKYSHLDYPVTPTLFMEFTGSPSGVEEQAQIVGNARSP